MFRIFLLFLSLMITSSMKSQAVYILEFVNPTQNATSLTWTAQIRAISGSFVMGASNIRYNFNNSGLTPNTAPTFVASVGFQLDVTGFIGSVPNRVAVVSFSPTSASGITITTTPTVIGTITHNKLPNLSSGTLASVMIREWNVPGYTSNLPPPTPNQLGNCTLIYDASGDENIYQAGTPVNLDPNISLPIVIKEFSAYKINETSANLIWISSSEINASHYEVERGFDAENFENIGKIDASGNSFTQVRYEYFDRNVPSLRSGSVVYYRLKMVDLDGSYEYSDIRGLNFGNALEGVFMYPNPTNQWLNVDVSGVDFDDAPAELNVFDMDGKLVITKKVTGSGIEALDMGQVSAGMYHVVLKKGRDVYNEKVVVID